MSFTVNGTNFPLTTGTYTASFPAAFDDVVSNYHLIAVSDADSSDSTVEFAGGIFVAASVTASPPQNILYVFGSNASDVPTSGGDTVNIYGPTDSNPNTVVFDNGAPFSIGSTITGIHVRGEAGNDSFEAASNVTLPLWLYGGNGTNTLTGGSGNNVIVGGSGQNTIHSSNGVSTPETVDDSDVAATGLADYFQKRAPGPAFPLQGPSTAKSNRTQKAPAATKQSGRLPISIRAGIMTYMSHGRRSPCLDGRPIQHLRRFDPAWRDAAHGQPNRVAGRPPGGRRVLA